MSDIEVTVVSGVAVDVVVTSGPQGPVGPAGAAGAAGAPGYVTLTGALGAGLAVISTVPAPVASWLIALTDGVSSYVTRVTAVSLGAVVEWNSSTVSTLNLGTPPFVISVAENAGNLELSASGAGWTYIVREDVI